MRHPLDRPAWTALSTRHAAFARGGAGARRYDPSIVPFAAAASDEAEDLRALESLVGPGENVLLLQADPIVLPNGLAASSTATGVQMIAEGAPPPGEDAGIERLTEVDAPRMLALATLTRPGPFTARALALGEFWGLRDGDRLVAMAGERMKQPGYTEISGVCVHPDLRGRGLARLLSLFVAARIAARGETPYLHAYATNKAAIGLYESIGFRIRTEVGVAVVQRAD